MAGLRIYYDAEGATITVWFDDPQKEWVVEETGEEVLLIKDREGHVIGFERLNIRLDAAGTLPVEAIAV